MTLYFNNVKAGKELDYYVEDIYYDESIYLFETIDDGYYCTLPIEEFVKQEAYNYLMAGAYISIRKSYIRSFDEMTHEGLLVRFECNFFELFKQNKGLYEELRESYDEKSRPIFDEIFSKYKSK